MSADITLAGLASRTTARLAHDRQRDRRFFTGMALLVAVAVFVGFAPTFYLTRVFGPHPAVPLVHLHGAVMTVWILLFVTQTSLVAAHRTDLHRRLGIAGAALVPVIVIIGYFTAIEGARRGVPVGVSPVAFLSVTLGTLAAFTVMAILGLANRRRSEVHKRLMLLATIALIAPALARFRFIGGGGPVTAIGGTVAFVLACMVYDGWTHRRVHPAFLWGGLFVVLALPARLALGKTEAWQSLARWIIG
ncbi:MAG TPA: hypothetical protein VFW66_13475 [Gemmatimonadales bacterium]|nr:hypothetical protein [Gemmatimonadales bacterium]